MMTSYNKTITILSVLIAFAISISLLTIILSDHHNTNYISIEEEKFYSQFFEEDEKKIFILGASPVNAINAEIVNNIVKKTDEKFKIYNLAKGSDDPDKRKDSLEKIINSKPKIVLYGIGYRDFQEKISVNDFSDTKEVESILPVPHDFFEEYLLSELRFYDLELDYLKNPKLSSFQIIKSINEENIRENKDGSELILDKDHPLRTPEQTQKAYVKKTDDYLMDSAEKSKNSLERYGIEPAYKNRYSISLNNIIERLQENDIHVILFTYPHHRYYLENVPEDDKEEFLEIINNARNKYDITVKFFHQEYSDKENWSDLIHIFYNYKLEENNEDSIQYSNDIADLILNEIKENVI